MTSARGLDSGQHSGDRGRFVMALQAAAALLMAHQIGGKAARDGLFLLHYGPRGLPAMIAAAAGFSILLSIVNGRVMRRLPPRSVIPWMLVLSGVLQIAEWLALQVSPAVAAVLIYLHIAGVGVVLLSTFWSMLNEE